MRPFLSKVGFWGPRPCCNNAPTLVASHDLSEREPLLVGHKRLRRQSSVASIFNIASASDLVRRRLSRRCAKYLRIALLALRKSQGTIC